MGAGASTNSNEEKLDEGTKNISKEVVLETKNKVKAKFLFRQVIIQYQIVPDSKSNCGW